MKKILVVSLIFICLMTSSLFLTNNVSGTTGDITLTNWDSVATGTFSGAVNDVIITRMVGGTNYVVDEGWASSPKCYKSSGNSAGWINLTDDYSYINSVHLAIKFTATGVPWDTDTFLKFYNDGILVLEFNCGTYTTSNKLRFKDAVGDWKDIPSNTFNYEEHEFWLNITHIDTNYMNYNLSGRGNADGSSASAQNWTTFDSIYIITDMDTFPSILKIDDIIINLNPVSGSTYFIPDLGNVTGRCTAETVGYSQIATYGVCGGTINWQCIFTSPIWDFGHCITGCVNTVPTKYIEHETEQFFSERIRHVILPVGLSQIYYVSDDVNDYSMRINGNEFNEPDYIQEYGTEYGLVWENVNLTISNERIVFAFESKEHTVGLSKDWYWYAVGISYATTGISKTHNDASQYANSVVDGTYPNNMRFTPCWYYDSVSDNPQPDPVPIPVITEYDTTFGTGDNGTGYGEFLDYNIGCRWYEGDKGVFNYNFTGLTDGTVKNVMYVLYLDNGDSFDTIIDFGYIEINNGTYRRGQRTFQYAFPSMGSYYILFFNTSNYGNTQKEFIHQSLILKVCQKDEIPADVGKKVLPTIAQPLGSIVGLIITVFLLLSPFILQGALHLTVSIPAIVYALTGGMGIAISTILGLFPPWLPLFIILIGILVIIIVYFTKSGGGGE